MMDYFSPRLFFLCARTRHARANFRVQNLQKLRANKSSKSGLYKVNFFNFSTRLDSIEVEFTYLSYNRPISEEPPLGPQEYRVYR